MALAHILGINQDIIQVDNNKNVEFFGVMA